MHSLLDTRLLIHADAADEPVKRRHALKVIGEHRAAGSAVLSTQVLKAFVNASLCKLKLPTGLIRQRLALYCRFKLVSETPDLLSAALDLRVPHSLPYHRCVNVLAAIASRCGCGCVLSEDMRHGRVFGEVRMVNPFG